RGVDVDLDETVRGRPAFLDASGELTCERLRRQRLPNLDGDGLRDRHGRAQQRGGSSGARGPADARGPARVPGEDRQRDGERRGERSETWAASGSSEPGHE